MDGAPRKPLVQLHGGFAKLVVTEASPRMNDAVLHLALVEHEYDEHAIARKRQEFHLTQGLLCRAGHGHDAGLAGDGRQQARRTLQQITGVAIGTEFLAQCLEGVVVGMVPDLQ